MSGLLSDRHSDTVLGALFVVLPVKDIASKTYATGACSRVSHVAAISQHYLPDG